MLYGVGIVRIHSPEINVYFLKSLYSITKYRKSQINNFFFLYVEEILHDMQHMTLHPSGVLNFYRLKLPAFCSYRWLRG